MSDMDIKEALNILELPSEASIREVRAAYRRMKELYQKGSLATSPVEDELTQEQREALLKQIEEAYKSIVACMDGGGGLGFDVMRLDAEGLKEAGIERLDGTGLKQVRELLGVGLGEIELKTRITARYLIAIEEHDFPVLPEEVFVQGYVAGYARALGVDHARAVKEFLEVFNK